MTLRGFLTLVLCLCGVAARAAGPYGGDNGWDIDNNGNALFTSSVAASFNQAEIGWIRMEARLIPGHTNWDSAMLGYYDNVVNIAHAAGIQVLLLIDNTSATANQAAWNTNNYENNPGMNGDTAYAESFATNAVLPVVQHFHDRVKYYEIWNEPNAWTSNPSNGVYTGGSFIYPSIYGWLLARSWEVVHKTYNITDVTLFSGGVFGHDISGVKSYANAGAQYIDDFYSTGTNTLKGGSFAYIKSKYNAYPLDGVGEHLYIDQGGTTSASTFAQYLAWVRQAYTKYEGANTSKNTFITEFAWTTASVSQAVQDTNLVLSFSTIQSTPYVQMAIWFEIEDNVAGGQYYGVETSSGAPKTAYPDYQKYHRFEGIYSNLTTNISIYNYFTSLGAPALGNPCNIGSNWWVYAVGNGFAQDYFGGSHSNLVVFSSSYGTFEVNNLHGLFANYETNYGLANYGFPTNNEYSVGSGRRQDFQYGYLTWDSTNQAVWHLTAPFLAGSQNGGTVALSWNGPFVLQWATNAVGPYFDLTNAASPFSTNPAWPQEFFRLRN